MFSWRTGLLSVVLLWTVGIALTQEEPKKPKLTAEDKAEPGQIRKVRTLEQPGKAITGLSFSADGSRLVTSGGRSTHLWDPATGKELARFGHKDEHAGTVVLSSDSRLSPDGRTMAVCFGMRKEVLLVDAASGKILQRLPHPGDVFQFAFSPDGKTLISAGGNPAVYLWDVATGKELRLMRLRDPATGKELDPKRLRQSQFEDGYGVAFSPDGKTVAVGVSDGSIRLCDSATGAETRRLFHEDDINAEVYHLAFSPDGRYLAAGGLHFRVGARLWDLTTGKAVREFRLPPHPVYHAVPEEMKAFVEAMAARRRPEGRERADRTPALAQALAFSPDGKTLAISRDKTWLCEVATGRVRHQVSLSTRVLAFSSTGLLAIPGEEYALVNLWDWRDPCLERPDRLGAQEIDRLWADLAGEDAAAGYRAIATLAAVPAQAVEMLAQRVQPVEPVKAQQVNQLIAELDDGSFAAREKALGRLAALGEAVRPALQQALAKHPSAEVRERVRRLLGQLEVPPSPGQVRHLRAVEALEYIGTAEAQRVLQKLADGAPGALETEDARAALKRLTRK